MDKLPANTAGDPGQLEKFGQGMREAAQTHSEPKTPSQADPQVEKILGSFRKPK